MTLRRGRGLATMLSGARRLAVALATVLALSLVALHLAHAGGARPPGADAHAYHQTHAPPAADAAGSRPAHEHGDAMAHCCVLPAPDAAPPSPQRGRAPTAAQTARAPAERPSPPNPPPRGA